MIVDALGDIVVHAEQGDAGHPLAILVLSCRPWVAARGARAFDAEQVVIFGGQLALAPARFLDGLGDRHRRGDAVPALRGNRSRCDFTDERLLGWLCRAEASSAGAGWCPLSGAAGGAGEPAGSCCAVSGTPGIAAVPGISACGAATGPDGPAPGAFGWAALPWPACCGGRLRCDAYFRRRWIGWRAAGLRWPARGGGTVSPGISALPGVRARPASGRAGGS